MRLTAVILLVASGCSLVMSRPSEELQGDEPVAVRGPILSGLWHGVSDKVHAIKETVVKPIVEGVVEGAEGAKDIFKDTVHAINTDVVKPAMDAANNAWEGVSNTVHDIHEAVVQPVVDGVHEGADGAKDIFKDTVHDINAHVIKPAIDAAYNTATGALQTIDHAIDALNSGIKEGIDAVHAGAVNSMSVTEGLEPESNEAAQAVDVVDETSNDI